METIRTSLVPGEWVLSIDLSDTYLHIPNHPNSRTQTQTGKKGHTHKCSRVEGGFPGPSKLQGPVSELNSVGCKGQLNSGSLHKQTWRDSLSRDVCSPVEDHDLVPSLSHNVESQTHPRLSECDG